MYHKQQIFDFGADQDHVQNPVFFLNWIFITAR